MTFFTVTNDTELSAAVGKAAGGDTIALASGNYSMLTISAKTYSAPLTITSLDASAPAHINRFNLSQSTNVTLSHLDFGRALTATETSSLTLNQVYGSKNIVIDSSSFHGSLDGNPQNDGMLLSVRSSDSVTVSNSDFTEGYRAAYFQRTSNLSVTGNDVHLLRSDGFDFASVQNVRIQGNTIGGFVPITGDHPDAIQFWTSGETVASSHITISDNVILAPMGAGNQGIFMSDEVGTLAYEDVHITNNLLYSNGGQWHGIFVNHVNGGAIGNNTVVSTTLDTMRYWIDICNSQNLDVTGNITDQVIVSGSTDIRLADNIDFTLNPSARSLIPNLNLGDLTTVSNLLVSGVGYQVPSTDAGSAGGSGGAGGTGGNDGTGGTGGSTIIAENPVYGTTGSDLLHGTAGKDKIWGVAANDSALGRGTVDKLWGDGGTDTFVLGDPRGRFYDDGKSKTAGKGDYAQIMDFAAGDHIQLHGSMDQYLMKAGSVGGLSGLQIFFDSNDNGKIDSRDELIGHVVGVNALTPDAFVFG